MTVRRPPRQGASCSRFGRFGCLGRPGQGEPRHPRPEAEDRQDHPGEGRAQRPRGASADPRGDRRRRAMGCPLARAAARPRAPEAAGQATQGARAPRSPRAPPGADAGRSPCPPDRRPVPLREGRVLRRAERGGHRHGAGAVPPATVARTGALALHPAFGRGRTGARLALEGARVSAIAVRKSRSDRGPGSRADRWPAPEPARARRAIGLAPAPAAVPEKRNPCFGKRHVESPAPGAPLSADTVVPGSLKGGRPGPPARGGGHLRLPCLRRPPPPRAARGRRRGAPQRRAARSHATSTCRAGRCRPPTAGTSAARRTAPTSPARTAAASGTAAPRPARPRTDGFVGRFDGTVPDGFLRAKRRETFHDSVEALRPGLDARLLPDHAGRPRLGQPGRGGHHRRAAAPPPPAAERATAPDARPSRPAAAPRTAPDARRPAPLDPAPATASGPSGPGRRLPPRGREPGGATRRILVPAGVVGLGSRVGGRRPLPRPRGGARQDGLLGGLRVGDGLPGRFGRGRVGPRKRPPGDPPPQVEDPSRPTAGRRQDSDVRRGPRPQGPAAATSCRSLHQVRGQQAARAFTVARRRRSRPRTGTRA